MDKQQKGSHAQGDNPVEKQASQLAYDVKYKVKQQLNKGTKMSPAQVAKAYLAQLAKSPAQPAVKALAKKKLIGEEYTSDMKDLVQKSVVNALVKVFNEGVEEKKYKVRVTDKATGNTYVRNATRAKIAELRGNPNISSVEITQYGEVSGDEKSKGAKTAAAKAGKDYDGDGKVESGAKEYRGAVHNAIQRKKGGKADGKDTSSVKEEFLGEVKEKTEKKSKTITGDKVNNYSGKDSVVKLFPNLGEQALEKPDANGKRQIVSLQQFQNKERQLNQKKLAAQKSGQIPVGSVQMNSFEPQGDSVEESGDYWHPDPKKDRQISGAGNKARAREDAAEKSKPKEDPKKLRPGESYMDYAKRQGTKSSAPAKPKERNRDKIGRALGKAIDRLGGINKEEVEIEEGLKQARKNVGASTCWDGYVAKGTKKKDGKEVPNCVKEEQIEEKAVSKAQQKFMGMVYAAKKGEEPASPEVAKAAAGISKKEAKKFAGTKHKGLPEVKEETDKKCDCDCGQSPCVKCGKDHHDEDPRGMKTKSDLIKNKLRSMGLKMSYDLEGDTLDELNRYEKETGKDYKTGKEVKSGGSTDKAFTTVKKMMRSQTGKPAGQRKKEPGKKPPVAGSYGAPQSPAQKVALRRAAAKRSQDNMSSRYD